MYKNKYKGLIIFQSLFLWGKNMNEIERIQKIVDPIVKWYQENARPLPWRKDQDPYHIWISEIMLQQTRIEAVIDYYHRFLQALPTLHDLANVPEEKLLKLWEGLGYYNRARNLKKAAQMVEEKYGGTMPKSYDELVKLPGIGEYTAGAISSISYGEPVPAVDGNVLRVLHRVTANEQDVLEPKAKTYMRKKLLQVMPKKSGDFNQGVMELGENICLPNGDPLCEKCPIQEWCLAYQENLTDELPVRIQKTKRKLEQKTVFLLKWQNQIAIQKRKEKGLLANLYEFPNAEGYLNKKEREKQIKSWNLGKIMNENGIKNYKHIFSHVEWHVKSYEVEVEKKSDAFIWVTVDELDTHYAIPGAFKPIKDFLMRK